MLRRNRADTFLEIRLTASSRIKFLHARSCHSASGASRTDFICWTHFCSSRISTTSTKLSCAWITFFSAARYFSVDPLLLVPLVGQSAGPGGCSFSPRGPSFPRSFSLRDTAGCRFFAMGAARARFHRSLRWTHFYSFRLLDEGPFAGRFRFTRWVTGLRDIGIQEARQRGGFVFRAVRPTS
jgi:hypothetical protein